MPKQTTDQRLASIDEARQRWQRKLSRATNALAKLERQRKRLLAKQLETKPKGAVEIFVEMKREADAERPTSEIFPDPVTETVTPAVQAVGVVIPVPHVPSAAVPPDALDIPTFLKRGLAAQTAVDKAIEEAKRKDAEAAAAIKAEAHERKLKKARGRIAKLKAKQSGETKAMPLTGKAALEAIRRGHR